jgi:hypothetical protein
MTMMMDGDLKETPKRNKTFYGSPFDHLSYQMYFLQAILIIFSTSTMKNYIDDEEKSWRYLINLCVIELDARMFFPLLLLFW